MNKVILSGNVGSIEIVDNKELGKIANIQLATNEYYKDKNGEKKIITDWHSLVVYRGLAEIAEKYISKGDKIQVCGKSKKRNWEDENKVKREKSFIVVDEIDFVSSSKREVVCESEDQTNDDLPF